MDEEKNETVEEDVSVIEEDVVDRILNNAMPKAIDTEKKINEILGIQQ